MCSDLVRFDTELFGPKNGQTVAKSVGDLLARHVMDLPVMPNGGDVCIVVCSGIVAYSFY